MQTSGLREGNQKLIQHDAQLCGRCSSCFIDKSEQDDLIHHIVISLFR